MADALAIYGAAIGSAAAVGTAWNIYTGLRDRPRLKVSPSITRLTWTPDTLQCVGVEVANVGRRPINLQSCTIESSDRRAMFFLEGSFRRLGPMGSLAFESHKVPKRLQEGESHTFLIPIATITDSLARDRTFHPMSVSVRDGTGRKWRAPLANDLVQCVRSG